jgi:proline iminopeptidase
MCVREQKGERVGMRGFVYMFGTLVLSLMFSGCDVGHKYIQRETILDKVISIPEKLVLDIPKIPPLCDSMSGLKKDLIPVDGGMLYYEEEGQGVPLILLNPGPGGSHHCFHPHFSCLKDTMRIIYYDMRGVGKSSRDDTGEYYTIKHAVEDIEQLRQALHIDSWVVLGWSFGGFLAQCYALTYPESVKGMILVASADGLSKVNMKPSRQQMFISQKEREAIKKIFASERDGKLSLAQLLYNKDLCGDWKRQHYYKPTNDEMIRSALYEWLPAPGFREIICPDTNKINLAGLFDDCEIPTLIFEGKWDLTWNTDKIEFMRKNHPHARVELCEKSGHKIFADEPEKFFGILREFLENIKEIKIKYKPGEKLTFPEPVSEFVRSVMIADALTDKKEKEKQFLHIYDQAVRENETDPEVWNAIANYFVDKSYEKSLDAFCRYERCEKKASPDKWLNVGYCIKAWQGHLLDLLGRREEAIACYKEALKTCDGKDVSYYMKIDRAWLEARLKKPFSWDMFKF